MPALPRSATYRRAFRAPPVRRVLSAGPWAVAASLILVDAAALRCGVVLKILPRDVDPAALSGPPPAIADGSHRRLRSV
jgi:hypothetical protein